MLSQVNRRLTVGGDVPTLNSRAIANPLVGGVHHPLEIKVRQDLFRQVRAGSGDT